MPKYRIFLIGFVFLLALQGLQSQAFAEQLNASVKDCIEKPELCAGPEKASQKDGIKIENEKEAPISSTSVQENNPDKIGLTAWDFIKMILATIFVVVLLYFVLKFVNKKSTMFKSSQLIENLGGVPLGSNRSVQIIKVGNRLFIVGVGENIQLLKEIDDKEEYQEILSEYNSKLDQLLQPNKWLSKWSGIARKQKGSDMGETSPVFQNMLQERLNELSKERKKMYEEVRKSGGTDKQ